jgi:hypothetical protein
MSENEDNYQPYAAGVPMDEPKATEEPLYEFTSATFTSGEPAVEVEAIEPEPTPEPELNLKPQRLRQRYGKRIRRLPTW